MTTFNTTVSQMTEMFQWPNCLSKNDRNVSVNKKPRTQIKKYQAIVKFYIFLRLLDVIYTASSCSFLYLGQK